MDGQNGGSSKPMRWMGKGLVVGAALSMLFACGDDARPKVADDSSPRGGSAGSGRGGGGPAGSDPGGAGGSDGADPAAPAVELIAPTPATHPDTDAILTGTEVTVTCSVKASTAEEARPVNESSIQLALLSADGEELAAKPGLPTDNVDEYANTFSLVDVPAGRVGFRCAAADEAKRQASDSVDTFLDRGPIIEFASPEASSFHPLTSLLDVEFSVEPSELTDDDEGSAVADVALEIGGTPIDDLSDYLVEGSAGTYRLQMNLTNLALFNPAPNGPFPLVVTAANSRRVPVSATLTQQVSIDGAGPGIEITAPKDTAVVGGKVRLTFTANDAVSGVDLSSVFVTVNNDEFIYSAESDAWSHASGTFTFEFDSRQFDEAKVQLTIGVGARDKVGNTSTGGAKASVILFLDNVPPSVDLDPANIRSVNLNNECTISFDPVGDLAKNDLSQAMEAGVFRALVWENTNSHSEIGSLHYAGVNQATVEIYLESDPSIPLLVNKDDDPECDDISKVGSQDSVGLKALAVQNRPWFATNDADVSPTPATLGCTTKVGNAPDKLCSDENSDMWQVIEHGNREQVIFARSPSSGLECTGISWEFGTKVDEDGWVCFAARAVDRAGNVGISRPLRTCVDDPSVPGTPPCASSSIDAPSCTDGCTPPPRWGGVGVLLR